MTVVEIVLTPEGQRHGHVLAPGKGGEIGGGGGRPVRAANDDEGAFGLGQPVERRAGLARAVRRGGDRRGYLVGDIGHGAQHILGQRQHHRAGAARGGHGKGAADVFGQALGLDDLDGPFGEATKDLAIVDLLKGLAVAVAAVDLADEEDHRRRILPGDVDTRGGIGGAGAAGDEGHAGGSGHLAMCLGHHRRAAFVAADDILDTALIEAVEGGEKALARHGKDPAHPLKFELISKNLAAVTHGTSSPRRGATMCQRVGKCNALWARAGWIFRSGSHRDRGGRAKNGAVCASAPDRPFLDGDPEVFQMGLPVGKRLG